MHRYLIYLLAVVLISNALGESQQTDGKQNQDRGKHSTIVEVDGYAYLSEDKTIRDMREEALTNAKRMALEQAQTYISSQSKVKNFQLEYDVVISEAEGAVRILENKDHGITGDNRYHTWIKAEVTYDLKPSGDDAKTTEDLVKDPDAPLTVHVWPEKTDYQAGEKIQIFMQGNKDFYARVVYRDVQGNLLQLLPNPHRRENHFEGGKVIVVPDPEDKFDLEVGPPFGIENIIVYASSSEMGDASVRNIGDAVYRVQDELENYGVKTRGVKLIKREEGGASGAEFYEARCEVKTKM